MSGLVELHLAPAVAGALESFGYSAEDQAVRDQVPAAARGTNLALAIPPAARYAAPALAGLVSALAVSESRALVLVPPHALAEWAAVLLPFAQSAGVSALAAAMPSRAARGLKDGKLRLLITTPGTALVLLERSALKADQLRHIVLAWPELFEHDDALTALMQDLPADAQRIVILADPRSGQPLMERYARRALVVGPLANPDDGLTQKPIVRIAPVAWSQRAAALAAVLESEDPASVVVWCADLASAAEARAALPVGDESVKVITGKAQPAAQIVAWDLPSPSAMAELREAGDLILLVPSHANAYVAQASSRQLMVRVRGAADDAREATARRRSVIEAELIRDGLEGDLLALAPLFERFDPARVAAALHRLWHNRAAEPVAAPAAAPSSSALPAVAKVWVSVGKKDGATANDLVGSLTKEVGLGAGKVGRIELKEAYSLVEVPAAEADEIARGLSGKTIRRQKVIAKVDRVRPTGDSRGPSGSSPRGKPVRPRP
jgi:ATP-dependent RNA helicase DeaD